MRDLFPAATRGAKVVSGVPSFSSKDANVAGFFRRSALRAELSLNAVRAAVVASEAPVEKVAEVSAASPSSTQAGCKCFGTVVVAQEEPVLMEEDDIVAPVPSMFGLSGADYERALVTASISRRAKRAREQENKCADIAQEERPAKQQRVVSLSEPVSAVERLLQAARSANTHIARKALRKLSSSPNFVNTVQHVLHECLIANSSAAVVRLVLAAYKRIAGPECSFDLSVPSCRSVTGEYPNDKLSLLCDAVRHCSYEQVRAFLEFGANPDFRMVSGCTALMVSAYKNDTRMIELLCDFGCDVLATMENGVSALSVAAFQGNAETIKLLIARGACVDQQTADGTTPLMTAVQECHEDIVRVLIAAGAQINLCKPNGSSPIIVAVRHRRASMIPLLGQAGCNPNLVLSNGASALVLACANGDLASVRALIALNADVTLPLNSGATALEYACHRGHKEIAAHLLQSLPSKLDETRFKRLAVVVNSRNNVELKVLLSVYARAELTDLHYAVFLDDIKIVHQNIGSSEVNFSANLRKELLALAKPACAAYLRRAFAPFSADNKDLWPKSFTKVSNDVFQDKTDIMQHVFSFCGRDWFAKN